MYRREDLEALPMAMRVVWGNEFIEKEYGHNGKVLVRISECPSGKLIRVRTIEELISQ
jgi:hypothetical protein